MRRGIAALTFALCAPAAASAGALHAGSYAVDVTPRAFPIITSGGFLAAKAERAEGTLNARAVALDDGAVRLVISVVDTLMMPRELLDRVKQAASRSTGIPPERMLISATHSHSAPAVMGALGTDPDLEYARFLEAKVLEAIEGAVKNLEPARAGWAVVEDFDHTHCRRWILRPDRVRQDPFGQFTVRANMHPGYENPDFVGPAGPVDPALTLLAFQSKDGRPLALIANYSMHYVGAPARVVSPDYYGLFVENMQRLIGSQNGARPFIAIMSQGTSGDQHWMDYSRPKKDMNIRMYADALASVAHNAYRRIEYRESVSLAMAETRLKMARRLAGPERLEWAKQLVAEMNGALPKNQQEVYAREQVLIAAEPERELKLQALRIGELGIAAIPDEVFAITGLKIKAQSPLRPAFNIELANGAEGYIPPPEQHKLGGYTTWAARTAGLEPDAEPKIVNAVLELLEKVSGKRRREPDRTPGAYARTVLASKPRAYWRSNEFSGPSALDSSGNRNQAVYGDGIAFYLDGPVGAGLPANRAPHYAGGRMAARLEGLGARYSIEMWFWNGLPTDARGVTGYLFSRGSDELSIGGTQRATGKLLFAGGGRVLEGSTPLGTKTWHHVTLVRDGARVSVYLDGGITAELAGEAAAGNVSPDLYIGGRADTAATFEGRIDEVAVFGRALQATEAARHFIAAALPRAGERTASLFTQRPGF